MDITSPSGALYKVGEMIGETEHFSIRLCTLPDGSPGIIKVVPGPESNGTLDREAYLLSKMATEAEYLEEEYSRTHPGKTLNYKFCFPRLVESFVLSEEDGRLVIVLSLSFISEKVSDLVPLGHILSRDKKRVDPRTSAWILGKLLKILVFAHSQGIAIGKVSGDNILINREQHYVAIFDWSGAIIGDEVSEEISSAEIASCAREVILALGGDLESQSIPDDDQYESDPEDEFRSLLWKFSGGDEDSAQKAHKDFYALIRRLWPSKFHPFTACAVDKSTANTAEKTEEE